MRHKAFGFGLSLTSAALLLMAAVPQAALAEKAGARSATVIVNDQGFDKPLYTIGDGGGTHDADKPSVTFVNQGTKVHAVKTVPGTLDQGVQFAYAKDAAGQTTLSCWVDSGCPTGGYAEVLDTGGIPPGGSITFGFDPLDLPTDYIITSATDCLFGNHTPDFNCTPAKIHVSDNIKGLSPLSHSLKGSWILPVGDPGCRTDVAPVTPTIGPPFCYAKYGHSGRVEGSAKHPLNGATIHITDFGYDPAEVYVTVGSTVTWINTGKRVHSVKEGGGSTQGADDFHLMLSPGLGPGESYSYTFTQYSADDPAAPPTSFSSNIGLDLLPVRFGSTSVNSADNARPHCSTKKHPSCGTSLMTGSVHVIDPNAS
jgi:plastocyanin